MDREGIDRMTDSTPIRANTEPSPANNPPRSLRAVVIAGEGSSFSSGLDFASTADQRGRIVRALVPKRRSAANNFQAAGWAWLCVAATV